MIPSQPVIHSLHHLMLSVCSAAPKPAAELYAIATRRQCRAGVDESQRVCPELADLALENLHAFGHLARSDEGYRLTALGEKKLIALDDWLEVKRAVAS